MSPLLHNVAAAGAEGVALRGRPWEITTPDFFEPAERIRELFSQLINADADGVTIGPSVSYAAGIAARNVPVVRGQNIVVVEEQFPSNIYPWKKVANNADASVRVVSIPDRNWTNAIVQQIDDQTAVVAIPHIHWTTGVEFDLAQIGKRVREVGGVLLVDATQSLGTLPLDVEKVQPDFLVAAAYKCLLGPYGLTYTYVAPKWREGEPLEEGWLNRANSGDFSQLTSYCDDYVAGARRYDFGERSSTILLPMAIAALEQLNDWTVPRIEQYTRPLIARIVQQANALGLWHPPIDECSPCMVGIGLPGGSPNDLGKKLAEAGVYVSVRKNNARVAAHIYNSIKDVDRFFETLRQFT
jgi:selenocysteine lyase/cysteine desulfurase